MNTPATETCRCGDYTGEPCAWKGPRDETVLVEVMPDYLRASHRAARNWGCWPHNGAMRIRVHEECALMLERSDPDRYDGPVTD